MTAISHSGGCLGAAELWVPLEGGSPRAQLPHVPAVTLPTWVMGCSEHVGGHQSVLNCVFIGLYFQGCAVQIPAEVNLAPFHSMAWNGNAAQHFLAKKLRFMGHCQYQHMLTII